MEYMKNFRNIIIILITLQLLKYPIRSAEYIAEHKALPEVGIDLIIGTLVIFIICSCIILAALIIIRLFFAGEYDDYINDKVESFLEWYKRLKQKI